MSKSLDNIDLRELEQDLLLKVVDMDSNQAFEQIKTLIKTTTNQQILEKLNAILAKMVIAKESALTVGGITNQLSEPTVLTPNSQPVANDNAMEQKISDFIAARNEAVKEIAKNAKVFNEEGEAVNLAQVDKTAVVQTTNQEALVKINEMLKKFAALGFEVNNPPVQGKEESEAKVAVVNLPKGYERRNIFTLNEEEIRDAAQKANLERKEAEEKLRAEEKAKQEAEAEMQKIEVEKKARWEDMLKNLQQESQNRQQAEEARRKNAAKEIMQNAFMVVFGSANVKELSALSKMVREQDLSHIAVRNNYEPTISPREPKASRVSPLTIELIAA